jgi:hypothetical protein
MYTLQHDSAVQISHQQEDVRYTERNIKGENKVKNIIPEELCNMVVN